MLTRKIEMLTSRNGFQFKTFQTKLDQTPRNTSGQSLKSSYILRRTEKSERNLQTFLTLLSILISNKNWRFRQI